MLLAHDHIDVWIAVHEALVCLVLNKGRAEEHNVVKLALEGSPQLVHKILCLTGIGGPNNKGVEGQLYWVHYTLVLVFQALASSLCISPWGLRAVRSYGRS